MRVHRQQEPVITASCSPPEQFEGSRECLQQRRSALSFVASETLRQLHTKAASHQGSFTPGQLHIKAAMVDWAVIAAPFLLPISFIWDAFCFSRLWITYWLAQPDKQHSAKVFAVQAQVTTCLFLLHLNPRLSSFKIGEF